MFTVLKNHDVSWCFLCFVFLKTLELFNPSKLQGLKSNNACFRLLRYRPFYPTAQAGTHWDWTDRVMIANPGSMWTMPSRQTWSASLMTSNSAISWVTQVTLSIQFLQVCYVRSMSEVCFETRIASWISLILRTRHLCQTHLSKRSKSQIMNTLMESQLIWSCYLS